MAADSWSAHQPCATHLCQSTPRHNAANICHRAVQLNCPFFTSNSSVWSRLLDVTAEQAQILTVSIAKCSVNMTDAKVLPRLGQLLCFYTNYVAGLDPAGVQIILDFLPQCTNNIKELQQRLLQSLAGTMKNLSAEALRTLGKKALGLSPAQITNLSTEAVEGALESLGNVTGWSKAQLQAIIRRVNVTDQRILHMGSLIGGLSVGKLRAVNGSVLMKALSGEAAAAALQEMSGAQRKSIVSRALEVTNVRSVLVQLPDNLLQDVPISMIRDLDNSTAGELLRRSKALSKAQILAVMKKIPLESLNSSQAISELGSGIEGLSCEDLKQLSAEALEAVGRSSFTSRYLIQCAAKQYFKLMSLTKVLDFSSLTLEDLSSIPAPFLLYEPPLSILQMVPDAVCLYLVTLMGQADIKLLPRSSNRRTDLLSFIQNCLNVSQEHSVDQAQSLGSMVCVFGEQEMASLSTPVFLAIMEQLKTCGRFDGSLKESVRQQILLAFNDTSVWTQEILLNLEVLAATLCREDLDRIPNTEDVKVALTSILSSMIRDFTPSVIQEFNNMPNMNSLNTKLSEIYNKSVSARRRRSTDCTNIVTPTTDTILQLGEANVVWTPSQLFCLPDPTFLDSLDTLASISSFSIDQLTALKMKSLQVFASPISNDHIASLKRINLAFTDSEVVSVFPQLNTDALSEISGYSEWASTSFRSRASHILGTYLHLMSESNLSGPELVALGYFLCVMPPDQIALINSSAYREAAWSLGNILCTDPLVLAALKNKAVEVFGSPAVWTADVCQEVGSALAGLSPGEVSQLSVTVMPFLPPECISLIPPDVFSAFSVPQLMSLGPENSLALSEQQRRSLSLLQLDAISGSLLGLPNTSGTARVSFTAPLAVVFFMISSM
ncbi:otoancorin-like [Pyxicephalus adspersus]|uniref:otoancorin-like n=1 Tax=Pyxicephalus adspersus TaxID=30357 RepID=UPI003B5BA1E3